MLKECKHKNKREVITKFLKLGHEELFVFCDDCNRTLFAGWRPLSCEKEI